MDRPANDNEFLGALISCADENNDCNIMDIIEKYGISDIDCIPFIKSLENSNMIKMTSFSIIHIYRKGLSSYISPESKITKSVFKSSISFLKFIITYALGIISGLLVAHFSHKFGWQ